MSGGKVKYHKDGDFDDPIVRCDDCAKVVFVSVLKHLGCCACGCRKVKNIQSLTPEEVEQIKDKIDPDFLALFEWVDDSVASVRGDEQTILKGSLN